MYTGAEFGLQGIYFYKGPAKWLWGEPFSSGASEGVITCFTLGPAAPGLGGPDGPDTHSYCLYCCPGHRLLSFPAFRAGEISCAGGWRCRGCVRGTDSTLRGAPARREPETADWRRDRQHL